MKATYRPVMPRDLRGAILGAVVLAMMLWVPVSARAQPAPQQHEHKTATEPEAPDAPEAGLPPYIPRLTDADRQAAFPDVDGHAAHDRALHSFVLIDRIEWQAGSGVDVVTADAKGWIGGDRNRLWFRAEADGDGDDGEGRVHALYGRQVWRWWEVVGGVRQDFGPGPSQTWAAAGIQGLAPYWFEVEVTGYLGAGGRTQLRFDVDYELLMTNRLVLQPLVELELNGKSDPDRGIEAGLSRSEAGFRLRYEIRREFAPYVGIVWEHLKGDGNDGARFVTGARLWF